MGVDVEEFGGAVLAADASAGEGERLLDVGAFVLFQRAKRRAVGGGGRLGMPVSEHEFFS